MPLCKRITEFGRLALTDDGLGVIIGLGFLAGISAMGIFVYAIGTEAAKYRYTTIYRSAIKEGDICADMWLKTRAADGQALIIREFSPLEEKTFIDFGNDGNLDLAIGKGTETFTLRQSSAANSRMWESMNDRFQRYREFLNSQNYGATA